MYEDLKHNAQVYMPDAVTFPELEFVDTDIIQLYNNLVFLSLLICLLSALNLAALYHYILEKRIRSLLVMRICGATKRRTVWLYLAECLCISIPIYFAGTAFYMLMLKTMLGSIFGLYRRSLFLEGLWPDFPSLPCGVIACHADHAGHPGET